MRLECLAKRIPELELSTGLKLKHWHIEGVYNVWVLLVSDIRKHHDLKELMRIATMNDHDLKKIFKAAFGQNIYQLLLSERINHAKNELENTGKKIIDIADECGYGNPEYFTRLFKKRVGITPTAYRSQYSTNKT